MKNDDDSESKRKARVIDWSPAAGKELGSLPEKIRNQFLSSLEQVSWGLQPGLAVAKLDAVGKGVMELKLNGSPAYRVVYTLKFPGRVVVLAARPKTCNGQDKQLIKAATLRLKATT